MWECGLSTGTLLAPNPCMLLPLARIPPSGAVSITTSCPLKVFSISLLVGIACFMSNASPRILLAAGSSAGYLNFKTWDMMPMTLDTLLCLSIKLENGSSVCSSGSTFILQTFKQARLISSAVSSEPARNSLIFFVGHLSSGESRKPPFIHFSPTTSCKVAFCLVGKSAGFDSPGHHLQSSMLEFLWMKSILVPVKRSNFPAGCCSCCKTDLLSEKKFIFSISTVAQISLWHWSANLTPSSAPRSSVFGAVSFLVPTVVTALVRMLLWIPDVVFIRT